MLTIDDMFEENIGEGKGLNAPEEKPPDLSEDLRVAEETIKMENMAEINSDKIKERLRQKTVRPSSSSSYKSKEESKVSEPEVVVTGTSSGSGSQYGSYNNYHNPYHNPYGGQYGKPVEAQVIKKDYIKPAKKGVGELFEDATREIINYEVQHHNYAGVDETDIFALCEKSSMEKRLQRMSKGHKELRKLSKRARMAKFISSAADVFSISIFASYIEGMDKKQ